MTPKEFQKQMNEARTKILSDFWQQIEGIALGIIHPDLPPEKVLVYPKLEKCLHCHNVGYEPEYKWERNQDYPDGVYISCRCGVRTYNFVEVDEEGKYDKQMSIDRAAEIWNRKSI